MTVLSADGAVRQASAIERARAGDHGALASLYEEHAGPVYRAALRLTGSRQDSEDVLHDVFLGLPELLRRYEERGQFGAWIRAVAARVALARRRHERRHHHADLDDARDSATRSTSGAMHANLEITRALDALPDSLRIVFVLRQLEGYSHDEIAGMAGISSGASRVRFLRALRHLRRTLGDER